MNKKAYVFLIDAIFAIVILIIGFLLISSNQVQQSTEIPLSLVSDNTINLFSNIRIDDLCNVQKNEEGDIESCGCSNHELENHCNDILNTDQTLLDYFGELYYRGQSDNNYLDDAETVFESIVVENVLIRDDVFGISFVIDDEEIYSNANNQESSKDLISSKKMIFGFYENLETGEIEFWGPYIARIDIWQT